ncbi:hypothetical protein HETIRDRAFT_453302 [Heterobasidion irregulare TC 32-1]|uniref:Uncharacterized protein n=1 Tax=Heterobasidion irregulare (strain TC 32-1) TaxID=747525 RepID=W4JYZ6_HETIT|nr:uncharacterized protein HETIRDRAFT_453302 [Heterobasidion irregulare TC 32-1]ETW78699.1 hypothetical protein HETIRDRAFT_453302 [Heterobasidion irregulare TC 32-1]
MAGRRDDPSLSRHASAPSRARSLHLQAFQFCKHSTYLFANDCHHTLRSVVHFSARFELKASAACDYGNRSPFMSCATGLRPSATHLRPSIRHSILAHSTPAGARLPRIETQEGELVIHQGSPFSPSAAATLRSWFVRCPLLPVSRSSYGWQATLCNRERKPASRQQAPHFPPAAAATPRPPFVRSRLRWPEAASHAPQLSHEGEPGFHLGDELCATPRPSKPSLAADRPAPKALVDFGFGFGF